MLIINENEDKVYISVTDNGCGFETTATYNTLGMNLISLLTEQLEGNSEITSDESGTSFSISFTKK